MKLLLKINNNIAANSPRDAVKEFYNCGYINENQYEIMIGVLDDRNKLSHVYNEEVFEDIHPKLESYNKIMNEVLNILEKVSIG